MGPIGRSPLDSHAGRKGAARALVMALTIATTVMPLSGCAGYVPGEKAYWDAKVKELCEKDGGVTIYERIPVSSAQFKNMSMVGGYASIPPRSSAKSSDLLFWDESVTVLRDANPKVWRSEQLIKRTVDEKVIARVVRYSRVGGDIPSPAHSSHFSCPDERVIFAQREKVLMLEEEQK